MSKRVWLQLAIEYFVDLLAMIITQVVSFLIVLNIGKAPNYTKSDILSYSVCVFVAYTAVVLIFKSSLNLSKRGKVMEVLTVARNTMLIFAVIAVLMVLTKNSLAASRYLYIIGIALYFVLSCAFRFVLKRYLSSGIQRSKWANLVGVITYAEVAEEFTEKIASNWVRNVKGVAIIDAVYEDGVYKVRHYDTVRDEKGNERKVYTKDYDVIKEVAGIPVTACGENFMDVIRADSLDEVFINLPYEEISQIGDFVEELESMGLRVNITIPSLEKLVDESKFDNLECAVHAGYPMATLQAREISVGGQIFKRFEDIVIGFIGSIIAVFVTAIFAIPIKVQSKGSVIFKQERIGKNGRHFNVYKLRSMVSNAEELKADLMDQNEMDGLMFKMKDDPRITKIGKFLRKTSLDEFPQFWNVLKGDMSVVGTRPPTANEYEMYESHHKRRLSMKPGITGLWQVSGRSDIQDFEEVVKLDCKYIDTWSPWLDIEIIFKTVGAVFKGDGAE